MTNLFWQLPWAGPQRIAGRDPAWSVMPSSGMGDAKAICVPVEDTPRAGLLLALADERAELPLVDAPMGGWTRLTAVAGKDHDGYLCLMGYDQPPGGVGDSWAITPSTVLLPVDLQRALVQLHEQLGDELARQVVGRKAKTIESTAPTESAESAADGRAGSSRSRVPQEAGVTFAFGSCQYPAGLMDGPPAQRSYQRLADYLNGQGNRLPDRLLLLGDQIYADATAGLLDPIRLDDRYRVPYEELMRMEPLREVMRKIPVWTMLDDHEIADNWEPYVKGALGARRDKGVAAFWNYQRGILPQDDIWLTSQAEPGWSLFMADTRTCREHRSEATLGTAKILGCKQTQELETWLQKQPREDLKIVTTAAMLLPRTVENLDEPLHLDGWPGYPASFYRLLKFLFDEDIQNVCFLSGDAHLGCDVVVTLSNPEQAHKTTIRSIHAPALYAPLPFANEQPWNLKLADEFMFPDSLHGPYTCTVEGKLLTPPGDGCCLLQADRVSGAWTVQVSVI